MEPDLGTTVPMSVCVSVFLSVCLSFILSDRPSVHVANTHSPLCATPRGAAAACGRRRAVEMFARIHELFTFAFMPSPSVDLCHCCCSPATSSLPRLLRHPLIFFYLLPSPPHLSTFHSPPESGNSIEFSPLPAFLRPALVLLHFRSTKQSGGTFFCFFLSLSYSLIIVLIALVSAVVVVVHA